MRHDNNGLTIHEIEMYWRKPHLSCNVLSNLIELMAFDAYYAI